jgi:transcriptional regulator of arginine metabolism
MQRRSRLQLIAEILDEEVVNDQESLRLRLHRQGVEVSQSSLSRDLKILGVQRVRMADGAWAYWMPPDRPAATSEKAFRARFAASVTAVKRSGFVVLIMTPPGEAQLVGRLLDQTRNPGLLGTVAGDDTVILIAEDESAAEILERHFTELLD